jgi:hypothetical protein
MMPAEAQNAIFDQIMSLQAAFAPATLTEKNLGQVRNIAKNKMQALHATVSTPTN